MYQVTVDGLDYVAETDMLDAFTKTRGIRRIYTATPGQRVYEIVVPREEEKTELKFAPQEVSTMPAKREPAEQAAMFEGKTLTVNGKKYELYDWCATKEEADEELKELKEQGYKAGKTAADEGNLIWRSGKGNLSENSITDDLAQSMKDELLAIEVYRDRGTKAYKSGDNKTRDLYQHISQEELSHYDELARRARETGGKVRLHEGKLSVCTGEEAKKLER